MAEFPALGVQCKQCSRLDFLPFKCSHCEEIFCKEHRETGSHSCPKFKELVESREEPLSLPPHEPHEKCPFCRTVVKNKHQLVLCVKCNLSHCLSHRHPESHECSQWKKEVEEELRKHSAKGTPVKPIVAPKGAKGAKNEALAKKVAFMKLKQQAKGLQSIPQQERLYFKLWIKKTDGQETEGCFFFSREWSFGRSVDWLASELKLTNNNNNPLLPKLVLSLRAIDEEINGQYFDMSLKLKEAIDSQTLSDGDQLALSYVSCIL